jgi:hypothetical protein
MGKRPPMPRRERGAHLLLPTRTKVLNGELDATFRRWYPRFRPEMPVLPAALRTNACLPVFGALQMSPASKLPALQFRECAAREHVLVLMRLWRRLARRRDGRGLEGPGYTP